MKEVAPVAPVYSAFNKNNLNKKNTSTNNSNTNTGNRNKNVNMGAGFNPLDSFFPYDPCLLRMLHEPIEKHYRAWKGVPGLDDVIDVEVEVDGDVCSIKGSAAGTSSENMSFNMRNDAIDGRSREGSVSSEDSENTYSMSSSTTPFGVNSTASFVSDNGNQSLNVSMSISMTETLGMGLLEEQEREKKLRDERSLREEAGRGRDRSRETYLDSRAQSMVSDCSLEDSSPGSSQRPYSSFNQYNAVMSYAQFDASVMKGVAGGVGGVGGAVGGGSVRVNQSTGTLGGIGGLVGGMRGDEATRGDRKGDGRGDVEDPVNVTQLADLAWIKPTRRPRQYSVGSTGSW